MNQKIPSNIGNTIKYEEFLKLPEGVIASGILSDSEDGLFIDNSGKLLKYVVVKYSNQDWAIYCLRKDTVKGMTEKESNSFIINTGIKVQLSYNIKKVFNCSKKVLDLYTH